MVVWEVAMEDRRKNKMQMVEKKQLMFDIILGVSLRLSSEGEVGRGSCEREIQSQ